MNNNQNGGNILPNLAHLGLPIGLSIIANKLDKDPEKKDKKKKDESQKGGDILSNNLLLELGLSILPFGLIALGDKGTYSEEKKTKKIRKN